VSGGAIAEALEVSYVDEGLSRISSALTLCPRMQNLAQFRGISAQEAEYWKSCFPRLREAHSRSFNFSELKTEDEIKPRIVILSKCCPGNCFSPFHSQQLMITQQALLKTRVLYLAQHRETGF
jgi:hypothetical protein